MDEYVRESKELKRRNLHSMSHPSGFGYVILTAGDLRFELRAHTKRNLPIRESTSFFTALRREMESAGFSNPTIKLLSSSSDDTDVQPMCIKIRAIAGEIQVTY
jgi:hypothetical protein